MHSKEAAPAKSTWIVEYAVKGPRKPQEPWKKLSGYFDTLELAEGFKTYISVKRQDHEYRVRELKPKVSFGPHNKGAYAAWMWLRGYDEDVIDANLLKDRRVDNFKKRRHNK